MNTKPFDIVGLAIVLATTIYAAVTYTEGALILGGFTALVYTCVLFAPGMGGRLGAAVIIPLMGLFIISFAVLTGDMWLSIIMAAASTRAGMLVLGEIYRPSPAPKLT